MGRIVPIVVFLVCVIYNVAQQIVLQLVLLEIEIASLAFMIMIKQEHSLKVMVIKQEIRAIHFYFILKLINFTIGRCRLVMMNDMLNIEISVADD